MNMIWILIFSKLTFTVILCHFNSHSYRQPQSSQRPTFSQLVEMLSRAEFELFMWEEEDLRDCDPQVKVIGAPLEVAQNLYLDMQNMYK